MARTNEEKEARRKARKDKKAQRQEKLKVLLTLTKTLPEIGDDQFLTQPREKFQKYWPALNAVLSFAESLKITGEKVDKTINRIILIGDKMASDTEVASDAEKAEFVEKMEKVWGITRKVMFAATLFTDDKVDEKIEKVIAIGDWISDVDDD